MSLCVLHLCYATTRSPRAWTFNCEVTVELEIELNLSDHSGVEIVDVGVCGACSGAVDLCEFIGYISVRD